MTADPLAPRESPPAREAPLPPSLARWPGFLLGKLRQRSLERGIARLAPLGIHPRHFGVLSVLASTGPRAQHELAALLLVNRTIMVSLVDELEALGLVERRRNPVDRRAYALELTDAGRKTLATALPAIRQAEDELLARLSDEERRRLIKIMQHLVLPADREAPPSLADRVGYLLALAERLGYDAVEQALAQIDLRVPAHGVIAVLDDEGPRSQRELAESLRVNRTVMVQVVDDLEAAGLAERRRNPTDRRAYALELTDAGRERAARAREVIAAVHERVFGPLSPEEREELHGLLLRTLEAP